MSKKNTNRNIMPLDINALRDNCWGRPLEFKAMYLNLLGLMWQNNGQIQDDEDYLMRVSEGSRKQWNLHRQALADLFYLTPGFWNLTRVRAAHAEAKALMDRMSKADA